MEGAAADQILAPALQLDPGSLDQALQGDFFLQPLDLAVSNPRHELSAPGPVKTQERAQLESILALMERAPPIPFSAAMAFPQRLAEQRKQQQITQQALADRADIHVTLLRRYEAGKTQPGLDTLKRIAVALSVSADQLLFDEDERGPQDESLRLHLAALDQLDDDERAGIRALIEGALLRHQARRLAQPT